jgi:hypothetical protein
MNPVMKAIRANEQRVTRFHTERGQLMPSSAWGSVPRAIRDRLRPPPPRPWIALPAVPYLERLLTPDATVFEFGAGHSTIWFAQRVRRVVSLENNPVWYEDLRRQLALGSLTNCDLRLRPLAAFRAEIAAFPPESFDLISIDASERGGPSRLEYMAASRAHTKVGGAIVLDDSDRRRYRGADDMLPGWPVERFVGLRAEPLMATETSVYLRPAPH